MNDTSSKNDIDAPEKMQKTACENKNPAAQDELSKYALNEEELDSVAGGKELIGRRTKVGTEA